MKIGVVSDYPAREKLQFLGLIPQVVVCTIDENVNALKPHTKGFLKASELLGVFPANSLVIENRYERDGEAAHNAGMYFMIKERRVSGQPNRFVSYRELLDRLL
jgi:FMN phosphatase YigB (HAD superfamily)